MPFLRGSTVQSLHVLELQMIELISVPALVSRPRYFDGAPLDIRTWWTRPDLVALKALCEQSGDIEKGAAALGREPKNLAWKAYDTGLVVPKAWRSLLSSKKLKSQPRQNLSYPFISSVRGEHADIIAVNALVPRGLPDHIRGDVCQEIMLAILEGKTTLEELRLSSSLVRSFVRRANHDNMESGGYALSLDAPMRDGRSWYDVLPADENNDDLAYEFD